MFGDQHFRLYVDESGDHTIRLAEDIDTRRRYLGLVGVALQLKEHSAFSASLHKFKQEHCDECDPDDPPILHREDVLGKSEGFTRLRDNELAQAFHSAFIQVVDGTPFTVFAVVLDKVTHGRASYRKLKHPYHYCFHVLMERYCRFLQDQNVLGDVMAESRGGVEDKELREQYSLIFKHGTRYLKATDFQARLTSSAIKIKKKGANIAGLQLADMLAFGATKDVLMSFRKSDINPLGYLDKKLVDAIQSKYHAAPWARNAVNGFGRTLLA